MAAAGTLLFGTGCGQPDLDTCEEEWNECLALCAEADEVCKAECHEDYDECVEQVYAAEDDRAEAAAIAGEVGLACVAALACTAEAIGDGDGDGDDGWDEPAPEDDDWGDDWGERQPDGELELAPAPAPDGPLPDLGG